MFTISQMIKIIKNKPNYIEHLYKKIRILLKDSEWKHALYLE